MLEGVFNKMFGLTDEKIIKQMRKKVAKINAVEDTYIKLSNEELKAKTDEFKKRLENGETLDDILVDAFATVRETAKRVLGMRAYDVQLIGGMILHEA